MQVPPAESGGREGDVQLGVVIALQEFPRLPSTGAGDLGASLKSRFPGWRMEGGQLDNRGDSHSQLQMLLSPSLARGVGSPANPSLRPLSVREVLALIPSSLMKIVAGEIAGCRGNSQWRDSRFQSVSLGKGQPAVINVHPGPSAPGRYGHQDPVVWLIDALACGLLLGPTIEASRVLVVGDFNRPVEGLVKPVRANDPSRLFLPFPSDIRSFVFLLTSTLSSPCLV
uniref:Endonuclease/exonuclease/phosphatase domain-containing protein n=1 Tax=Chromera velia CCMP2878 TaxID=1169474 RepID=A0A0G4F5I7_9ALVE|eukprot:Cvel_15205.t1-p1 / transcript=Cvel_15205.t1 / gene=Cvel_15205 / organism=Chromera_velia_CCMP2878 / gene_product=hypothetical protein / transcript_product=hypothetical protein / location=Cvel_scaffold1112:15261-17276(+) / protein_length=226 / sequence_SO=supercontig / SO=protein_coding / is_pseudo=false